MEKACIFNIQKFSLHDGPGIRTVVFFKGCPLRCFWCSNPESQNGQPEQMWDNQKKAYTTVGEYKSIDEVITEVMKDEPFYEESGGGVTLSGGEVLYQADFATELLRQLKAKGIHTASETTAFARREVFERYIEQVDLLFLDVKHYNEAKHKAGTGVSLRPVLANLALALEKELELIVRVPVIPMFNDQLEDAAGFGRLFYQMGIQKVELLPFHQFGEQKYTYLDRDYALQDIPQLHAEDLAEYQAVIEGFGVKCRV